MAASRHGHLSDLRLQRPRPRAHGGRVADRERVRTLGEPQVGVDDDAFVLARHAGVGQPGGTLRHRPNDGGYVNPLASVEDGPGVDALDACVEPNVDAATAQRGLGEG